MRFQWSSSIPWDPSYSGYVKSKLYSTCRHSHALNCQVTPQNKVKIGIYVSRHDVHRLLRSFENVVRKPIHPMRHLNEVQVARVDFSSYCCGSQCLSGSYSPLVESLRCDWPIHKEDWTRLCTHDNPTGWPISGHLCIVALFSNCQRTATRPQEGHWSHGVLTRQ